jgi:hypothetical protein
VAETGPPGFDGAVPKLDRNANHKNNSHSHLRAGVFQCGIIEPVSVHLGKLRSHLHAHQHKCRTTKKGEVDDDGTGKSFGAANYLAVPWALQVLSLTVRAWMEAKPVCVARAKRDSILVCGGGKLSRVSLGEAKLSELRNEQIVPCTDSENQASGWRASRLFHIKLSV